MIEILNNGRRKKRQPAPPVAANANIAFFPPFCGRWP